MGEDNNLEPERTEPERNTPEPEPEEASASAGESGAPSPAAPASSGSAKGMTPGQRLAAKKAQKAVEKREFKDELKRKEEETRAEEQAEAERFLAPPREPALPDEVQKVAGDFTDFVQHNRGRITGGIAAVVIGALAFIGIRAQLRTGSAEQAGLLAAALETGSAQIDAEDTDGKTDDGKPVFKSREDREKKAAEAFAVAAKNSPDSLAAAWAQLGEAAQQVAGGEAAKAEPLYKNVYQNHADQPLLKARALEGLALTAEAQGKPDEALKRYEELKAADKDFAEYHIARLKLEKGDREGAKTLLKGVYDRLSDRTDGAPPSRFLKGEVEVRLAELDSSLVDKGTSGEGGQQFSPEELQRLLEQLRQQGGAGGAE
ncbi:MAG: hypothetical protein QM778_04475 [Myxococcales bacterium]